MHRICVVVFLWSGLFRLEAAPYSGVLPVKEWRGEWMRANEGAIYWRTQLNAFPKGVSSGITVTFYNIILQKNIVISQSQSPVDRFPREMWRVPSGKYAIDRIDLVDGSGVRRTWQRNPSSQWLVVVQRSTLSNLGIWALAPEGVTGLKAQFFPGKNVYTEEGPKKESSIAAVINGFTGIIQEVYGGNKVKGGSDNNFSDSSQLRGVVTATRQIYMTYRLDLLNDNSLNKDVMAAMSGSDANFRACYSRAVNGNTALRGNIVFKVLISDKTGSIRKLWRSAGSLIDGAVAECLVTELMQVSLPIRKNMIGELTFMFDMTQG